VERTQISPEERLRIKNLTAKPLLWIGLVSIIMFFAGLTSAYVIRQAQGDWLYFDIPPIFYTSTAVLILSSLTMWMGQRAGASGENGALAIWTLLTLALGITFATTQVTGWLRLSEQGVYFTGPESNISGSFFIIMVFAHAAHVFGGLIALAFTSVKALLKRYSVENHAGVTTTGIYWHFLDALWIYLILFLLFIR
jgi:cytochrome c oxidase subunit III